MDENARMAKAVFRYSVISDLVNARNLDRGEQERLIIEKCARKWVIPFSEKTSIGRSSILRWINLYKSSGSDLQSLYPRDRKDKGISRTLDEDTSMSLIRLRKEMPIATIPHLIEEMNKQRLVTAGTELRPSTVYRFLHQQDLMSSVSKPQDRRKFEAELPNDLWQSDVMHGPKIEINGRLRKTYLIAIIDDHSRLIPHAQFYLSEALTSYLVALEEAFLRRGLPRKLYVDNGPAFRSKHLEYITASLNIALIHARPYKPQGKGKIERWFKTIRSSFLPGFKGNTLYELNEAVCLWVDNVYHQRKHSSTGEPPFKRFTACMECLRPAPDNLRDHFRKSARRKVAKDRSITFKGRLYEAPVALIGKQIELLFHEKDYDHMEIRYQNKSYGIVRPVDLNVNCRVKRDENNMHDVIITSNGTDYSGGKLL
jgi:putative transposase